MHQALFIMSTSLKQAQQFMPVSLTISKYVATRCNSVEHSQRCHFQFATDFLFTITWSKGTNSWKDQNIPLILMPMIDHCHLRQVLTRAKHVSSYLQFVYAISLPFMYRKHIIHTHTHAHSSKHSKRPCCKGQLPQQVAFLTHRALTLKQH